jgi:membrane protease YdiL (CAAX protease family)
VPILWIGYLVVSLLLLEVVPALAYPIVVGVAGLVLVAVSARIAPINAVAWRPVPHDVGRLLGLYAACVVLFFIAFRVFGVDLVAGLFLSFAGGMLLGVIVPILHVVRVQGRPLADLGLSRRRLPEVLALAVALAVIQSALTLPKVTFGAPETWLPLLAMALTVGFFEAVFFRAYVIAILEPMFGIVPAVAASALLYALYHVGYGMDAEAMVFLFGLGIVYVVAFVVARNVLVVWPLLTPLGGFFVTVRGGEIEMPMVAILGFLDVFGVMLAAVFLANRWMRRHPRPPTAMLNEA